MKNRVIRLVKKTYWPACDNKDMEGVANEELIGGVPAGVEGELIPRYQIPSIWDKEKKMQVWEFVPKLAIYKPFGRGKYMTIGDHLYNAFLEASEMPGEASH